MLAIGTLVECPPVLASHCRDDNQTPESHRSWELHQHRRGAGEGHVEVHHHPYGDDAVTGFVHNVGVASYVFRRGTGENAICLLAFWLSIRALHAQVRCHF
jgi:hypothetical protein